VNGGRRLLLVNAHGANDVAGGAEGYVGRVADGFAARGYHVEVVSAYPSETRGRRITTLHATHWRTNRITRLRSHAGAVISLPTPRLREIVARAAPDVLHTSNLPGISTAIWEVARRQQIPVVHTIHDYHLLCPRTTLLRPDGTPCRPHPLLCGLRMRRLARWAGAVSYVIGVSQYVLDLHAQLFPHATMEKIAPLAPPPSRPLKPPRERLQTIGYLGALEHTKGVMRLLEAAPLLEPLGIEILVAGGGRLRAEVEAVAAREANVQYQGLVSGPQKDRFFEHCDAGILPSVWQEPGAPATVVLEWLAAGRPLLTSARGGLAEAIPELHGTIEIEPTAQGIVRAVEGLLAPGRWGEAVRAVCPPIGERDVERWLDKHERAYLTALEQEKH
jgi:glycosyltransferase involved in cell wall biosynthesis